MSRLIDADALIEEIRHVEELNGIVFDDGGLFDGNKKAKEMWSLTKRNLEATIDEINRRPTIEERKRGEWLELTNTNHTYVCSVCGRILVNITDGKNTVTKNYPFCHCGADMRGGQDDSI